MIWQSIAIMTVIDVIIIGMTLFACWNCYIYRSILRQLQLVPGVYLCLAGLVLLMLFYLIDLATMFVLPHFIPMTQAMEIMSDLHLNYAWIVAVLAVGLIVAGLVYLIRILFPELDGLLEELNRHRTRLEEQVVKRTAELSTVNKELESYSYSIAHDLRAPLRSITGFSQILQEDTGHKLNAEEKGYFKRIIAASKRMAELIDDILELGRVTRSEEQHTEIDLTALAKSTVEQLCLADENHKIEWQIQEGLMAVGDKKSLALLLDNLLGNACKYSSKKPQAHIEFGSTVVEEGGAESPVYFVSDNGVGFDMQYVDKLFEPFHRLHNDAVFEGTGIGLAIVQRVVHRHSGRIWAEAEVGKGATFYFTLPGVQANFAPCSP